MDFVSPVLDVASHLCNCVGDRAVTVRRLPQNLNSLRTAMEKLDNVYRDVKERVEHEESHEKKRTRVVGGWIQSVEAMEKEVNELLAKGDEEIHKKCLGTCCPKNCRASYKLAKMVAEKMDAVAALQTEGNNFQEVAVPLPCPQVIESLPQNLSSLRTAMEKLNNVYKDVKERVEREESLEKKRTHAVGGWIQSVEAIEKEVNELLAKGDEEIHKKCVGTCCPKNYRASYKLAKMVAEKMDAVAALQTEVNNFQEVAVPLPSPQVIERPLDKTVGLASPFHEVRKLLQDEKVGTIGIYGMGGVGKTTLLKKINNKFFRSSHDFDIVIWVVVSKPANLQRVQETIRSRLQIPDDRWKESEDEKADEIRRVLKTKKFVLLLDDIWEPFDLRQVGIPRSNGPNGSKIVFTTRSADVCGHMEAQKRIKVECLASKEALSLFQAKVGEDTLNSHPDIPKLSEMVAKMCKGLPLALIVIARVMARAKTPEEWERKMQMWRDHPDKVQGTETDLFRVLAFSYDSLPDEAIKSCFLYCCLFPEDYEISSPHLIQLWTGEGFLDACDRIQGQEIIESLKDACLLENGRLDRDMGVEYLKMHDVIRDMALWLACEKGKKNKFVVKDGVGLIRAQEVEKWKDAERISLWNTSFEELREPPHFPNTKTFLFSSDRYMKSYPSGFCTHMPVVTVLDLSNNRRLMELPVEIGNLVTLQYLNLSCTEIKKLPVELKNLKKMRCLILDDMYSLESLPSQMVSSLSSLQLFSRYSVRFSPYGDDKGMVLEELEQLEHINDISLKLTSVLSAQTLFNSCRLQRFIRQLHLHTCNLLNLVQLSPYMEVLYISTCDDLEDVKIDWEKEVQVYLEFSNLRNVTIHRCQKLSNLSCLIYASSLQFLEVRFCWSMEKVIEDERSEGSDHIEPDLGVFSRLISLTLRCLPKLRSIYGRALPFPSLRHFRVIECPSLKKLPFDSNVGMSKKLEKIEGEQEWWDGLEWEDQTIMHNLTPYFQPRKT